MLNLAILSISDFENWNNDKSLSIGGSTGVIKNILPYLKADHIFLMGITSNKSNLHKELFFSENITLLPIIYVPYKSNIPLRIRALLFSISINKFLDKYHINSIYTHSEEMSFWIKPGYTILYHMHGSTNALVKAQVKLFRNKLFQYIWNYIRIKNIQNATKIIAIDNLCYDLVRKQNKQENTIVIPNFVDTKVFYKSYESSELLNHIQGNILVFVGRIEEVKGLELFVNTIIELNNRDNANWTGVFVGKGSYTNSISKFIQNQLAENLFYFAGAVSDSNELRKIYNRANALMISSYFEGIPMVILECIACGTPVVSTNVGGIKEFLADGNICSVLNNRDPGDFATLIMKLNSEKSPTANVFQFSAEKISMLLNELLSQ
jgi:glycosyltransferase involved in cell wall biosynthesis